MYHILHDRGCRLPGEIYVYTLCSGAFKLDTLTEMGEDWDMIGLLQRVNNWMRLAVDGVASQEGDHCISDRLLLPFILL